MSSHAIAGSTMYKTIRIAAKTTAIITIIWNAMLRNAVIPPPLAGENGNHYLPL